MDRVYELNWWDYQRMIPTRRLILADDLTVSQYEALPDHWVIPTTISVVDYRTDEMVGKLELAIYRATKSVLDFLDPAGVVKLPSLYTPPTYTKPVIKPKRIAKLPVTKEHVLASELPTIEPTITKPITKPIAPKPVTPAPIQQPTQQQIGLTTTCDYFQL